MAEDNVLPWEQYKCTKECKTSTEPCKTKRKKTGEEKKVDARIKLNKKVV